MCRVAGVALVVALAAAVFVPSVLAKTAVGVITSYSAPTAKKGGQVTIRAGKKAIVFRIAKGANVPSWVKVGPKAKITYTGSGSVRKMVVGAKKEAKIRNLQTNLPGAGNDAGDCPNCSGGGSGGGGT